MKTEIYNQKGEIIGKIELPKEIFGLSFNADLVHQVAVAQMSNRRQVSAHTKNRGEVRGGGRKPWQQKGTGRARHGSIRSPIWRGGGVVFGPRKEKNFKKKIPKKMKRKALLMVLSQKAKEKELIILDKIELEKGKTKEMAGIFSKLPCWGKTTFLILPSYDKKIFLATRNIPKVSVEEARNLNVLDLLNHKYLLMLRESINVIGNTFLNNKKS